MKKKKILKYITIALSIIIFLVNIFLYIKMNKTFHDTSQEPLNTLVKSAVYFALIVGNLIFLLIMWLVYFFTYIGKKIITKYSGRNKILIIALLVFLIPLLIICIIKLLMLMIFR